MTSIEKLSILYEDNHLLVINKPAGIPSQGAPAGAVSVVTLARDYLKHKYQKPGNVYIGVVSRLDAPVSGVLVLARTSKAARRLNEQFRESTPAKIYLALVEDNLPQPRGDWEDWLIHDEKSQRVRPVSVISTAPSIPGSRLAKLQYERIGAFNGLALVRVELITGRKHQIRVQFSSRDCPIAGDRKYASRRAWKNGIALHAQSLTLEHPTKREPMTIESSPPASWNLSRFRDDP